MAPAISGKANAWLAKAGISLKTVKPHLTQAGSWNIGGKQGSRSIPGNAWSARKVHGGITATRGWKFYKLSQQQMNRVVEMFTDELARQMEVTPD